MVLGVVVVLGVVGVVVVARSGVGGESQRVCLVKNCLGSREVPTKTVAIFSLKPYETLKKIGLEPMRHVDR